MWPWVSPCTFLCLNFPIHRVEYCSKTPQSTLIDVEILGSGIPEALSVIIIQPTGVMEKGFSYQVRYARTVYHLNDGRCVLPHNLRSSYICKWEHIQLTAGGRKRVWSSSSLPGGANTKTKPTLYTHYLKSPETLTSLQRQALTLTSHIPHAHDLITASLPSIPKQTCKQKKVSEDTKWLIRSVLINYTLP